MGTEGRGQGPEGGDPHSFIIQQALTGTRCGHSGWGSAWGTCSKGAKAIVRT